VGLFIQGPEHLLLRGSNALHLPLDLVQHLLLMVVTMGNLLMPQALNDVGSSVAKSNQSVINQSIINQLIN